MTKQKPNPSARRDVYVNHFRDTGWMSWTLAELRANLSKWESEIAPEYRDTIQFEIEVEGVAYSDGDTAVTKLTYRRPENDEELAARLAEEAELQARRDANDLRAYEALKAKFDKKA